MNIFDTYSELYEENLYLREHILDEDFSIFLSEGEQKFVHGQTFVHFPTDPDILKDLPALQEKMAHSTDPHRVVVNHVLQHADAKEELKSHMVQYMQGKKDPATNKWSGGATRLLQHIPNEYVNRNNQQVLSDDTVEALGEVKLPPMKIHVDFSALDLPDDHPFNGKIFSTEVTPHGAALRMNPHMFKSPTEHLGSVVKHVINLTEPKATIPKKSSTAFGMADEALHGSRQHATRQTLIASGPGVRTTGDKDVAIEGLTRGKEGLSTGVMSVQDSATAGTAGKNPNSKLLRGVGTGRSLGSLEAYRARVAGASAQRAAGRKFMKRFTESSLEAAKVRDHAVKSLGLHDMAATLHDDEELKGHFYDHVERLANASFRDPKATAKLQGHIESTYGEKPTSPEHAVKIVRRYFEGFNPEEHYPAGTGRFLTDRYLTGERHILKKTKEDPNSQDRTLSDYVSGLHLPHPQGLKHDPVYASLAAKHFADRPVQQSDEPAKAFRVQLDKAADVKRREEKMGDRKSMAAEWRALKNERSFSYVHRVLAQRGIPEEKRNELIASVNNPRDLIKRGKS